MNVYVTNCKDNMIECVQSFFFFAFLQPKVVSVLANEDQLNTHLFF